MNHLSVRCLSVWLHLSGVTRLHLLLMTGCVTEANRRAPVGKQTAPARTAVFTRGWINVHAKIKNVFANTGVKVGAFWSVCDGTERIHSRSHSQRLDYRQLSHRPLATQSTLYWGISHDNKKRECDPQLVGLTCCHRPLCIRQRQWSLIHEVLDQMMCNASFKAEWVKWSDSCLEFESHLKHRGKLVLWIISRRVKTARFLVIPDQRRSIVVPKRWFKVVLWED